MTYLVNPRIEQYCHDLTTGESPLLSELVQVTRARTRYPDNLSGRLVGQTLKLLAAISHSKAVLEIGMFTGYAALSMAEALPDDGNVYCCEANPEAVAIAKPFFQRSPHGHKITVLLGQALDTLPTLQGPFDLVFIDADKKAYGHYLQQVLPKVRQGGLIVIDDALWRGQVIEPPDERSQIIAQLNADIAGRADLDNVLLPIRHGLHIIRVRPDDTRRDNTTQTQASLSSNAPIAVT